MAPDTCARPDEKSRMGLVGIYRGQDETVYQRLDDGHDPVRAWRHRFDPESGAVTPFRSGYANAPCPPDAAP
jgi:hypothetical protein